MNTASSRAVYSNNRLKKHTADYYGNDIQVGGWSLLTWDSFECYIEESISRYIQVHPGTRCLLEQAVQGRLHRKVWWMAEYPGNSQRNSCWKFESNLEKEKIAVDSWFFSRGKQNSLLNCTLNLPVDGSKGDKGSLPQGRKALKCTSSDVEEAYPTLQLLNSDHGEDSDIEWTLFTLCIALVLTSKLWNWKRYREWQVRKHIFVF